MPKKTSVVDNKKIGSLYDIKGRHFFTDDKSIA
jgi:hypothetical protein